MIALLLADDRPDTRNPGHALSRALDRPQRRAVPPDVTKGRVVVVVGGEVVGVVVGARTDEGLDAVPPPSAVLDPPLSTGAVVGGSVVVVVAGVTPVPESEADDGAEAPGCSRATSTPRKAVTAPASTTDVWVRRRRRRCARARVPAEMRLRERLMFGDPGVWARAIATGSSARGGAYEANLTAA